MLDVEVKYSDEFEQRKAYLEQRINDRIQEISNSLKDPNRNTLPNEYEIKKAKQIIKEMLEDPLLVVLQEQLMLLLMRAVPEKIIIRNEQM